MLLLGGLGPKNELEAVGVDAMKGFFSEVGKHFMDHMSIRPITFEVRTLFSNSRTGTLTMVRSSRSSATARKWREHYARARGARTRVCTVNASDLMYVHFIRPRYLESANLDAASDWTCL